ncbi:coagulation factor IX [Rhinophrynus dorsalis]
MAAFSNILIIYILVYVCSAENTVFLSDKAASSLLRRHKRFNTGRMEEFVAGNLERECQEEKCSYEEAREVFENDEKTLQFWAKYIDGDQCVSNPCENGGNCKDDISAYVCWCRQGYSGKNCELELPVTCSVNNGGCQQMCREGPDKRATCSCAYGYKLGVDGKTCEDTVLYACGKVSSPEAIPKKVTRSIQDPEDHNFNIPYYQNETDQLKSYENTDEIVPVTEDYNTRIVGGTNSLKGEFPWQVHLVNTFGLGFCGGSVINEKWIVTAAHCFLKEGEFTVVAGEHNTEASDGTEQNRKVARIILHPLYNATMNLYNNDIALLELEKPLELNDYVKPICIGSKNFTEHLLRTEAYSMVTGWGYVWFRGRPAIVLQKLAVPYITRAICKKANRIHFSVNMFCAGYADQAKDSCQGDSGGPHATAYKNVWFLTGITSWGDKCAKKGKYGVYTRLSRYTDWIHATTKLT